MGLLDAGYLLLGVRDGAVVLLVVLLDQLIVLLLIVELLAVAGDAGLAGVDRALDLGYHPQQVSILLGISDIVKPGVLQSLLSRQPLRRVHFEQTNHETECLFRQAAHIPLF